MALVQGLRDLTYRDADARVELDRHMTRSAREARRANLLSVNISGCTNEEVEESIRIVTRNIKKKSGVVTYVVLYEDTDEASAHGRLGAWRDELVRELESYDEVICKHIPDPIDHESYATRLDYTVSLIVDIQDPVGVLVCRDKINIPARAFEGVEARDLKYRAFNRVNARSTRRNVQMSLASRRLHENANTWWRDHCWMVLLTHNIMLYIWVWFLSFFTCGLLARRWKSAVPQRKSCLVHITTPRRSSRHNKVRKLRYNVGYRPLNDCDQMYFLSYTGAARWWLWRLAMLLGSAFYAMLIYSILTHQLSDFWPCALMIFVPKGLFVRYFLVRRYIEPCSALWSYLRAQPSHKRVPGDEWPRMLVLLWEIAVCAFYAAGISMLAWCVWLRWLFASVNDRVVSMKYHTTRDFRERLQKEIFALQDADGPALEDTGLLAKRRAAETVRDLLLEAESGAASAEPAAPCLATHRKKCMCSGAPGNSCWPETSKNTDKEATCEMSHVPDNAWSETST
jgi:hypothetical protein